MSIQAIEIWNGSTNPGTIDQSLPFTEAKFLLIQANGIGADQWEFAAALEIAVPVERLVFAGGGGGGGGLPPIAVSTTYTKEVPLDVQIFETGAIALIPPQVDDSDLEMRLNLATAYPIDITVWAIAPIAGCDIADVCDKLDYANSILTAQAARSLVGDAVAIGSFAASLASFLSGNPLALPGVIAPLLSGTGLNQLPIGGEVEGVFDIVGDGYNVIFQ